MFFGPRLTETALSNTLRVSCQTAFNILMWVFSILSLKAFLLTVSVIPQHLTVTLPQFNCFVVF